MKVSKKKAALINNIVESLSNKPKLTVVTTNKGKRHYKGFVVTGLLYNSHKRFTKHFDADGISSARSINLWNGSIWGVLSNGKRELLIRINN
jgi:hypothetical protein